MKRTGEWRRKKPMPRSTKTMKRSRLKPVSTRKRSLETEAKRIHATYKKRYPTCQCCGRRPGEHIHEILAGSFRERARMLLSCILHLCCRCHVVVQGWTRAKQLACKAINDPKFYDLIEVCAVIGCPTAIVQSEVDAEIEMFNKR